MWSCVRRDETVESDLESAQRDVCCTLYFAEERTPTDELTSLSRYQVVDGEHAIYDIWLYCGDSGTIFDAGSTTVAAQVIQAGLECDDPLLIQRLGRAMATARLIGPGDSGYERYMANASFGSPRILGSWDLLDDTDRARAAMAWDFGGRESAIDALLSTTTTYIVEIGTRELVWWTVGTDAGLLFEGTHVIGHAIQFGFVCVDPVAWDQIAVARDAPPLFDWQTEELPFHPPDVYAPVDLAALVRAAATSS